jgi:hypothetical protein
MMFLEEEEGDMHFKLLDWQMVKVNPIPQSSFYF